MDLREPIACTCRIGDDKPLHGFIKNVGVMGVLIELPDLTGKLTMECCQRVSLEQNSKENGNLFSGMVGTLNWVYKDCIGVGFDSPIRATHGELMEWLEEQAVLCEETT